MKPFSPNSSIFKLHGFADASKLAYGAVIYLRIVRDNQAFVSLQLAKSKVASLKSYRIPRLELCAALILARLTHHFLRILQDSVIAVHLWSDSEDVLWYLKSHSFKWEVFAANRCAEMQEFVSKAQWHHVRLKHNPVDLISRGVLANEIVDNKLWWQGLSWLTEYSDAWPKSTFGQNRVKPELPELAREQPLTQRLFQPFALSPMLIGSLRIFTHF